jgi:hypothetical protein
MRTLKAKGASLKAAEQPIDTSTAAGKALLDMLGVFAEFETNLRRERQLEGIAKAKAEGVYKGGKRRLDRETVRAMFPLGRDLPPSPRPSAARGCRSIGYWAIALCRGLEASPTRSRVPRQCCAILASPHECILPCQGTWHRQVPGARIVKTALRSRSCASASSATW